MDYTCINDCVLTEQNGEKEMLCTDLYMTYRMVDAHEEAGMPFTDTNGLTRKPQTYQVFYASQTAKRKLS